MQITKTEYNAKLLEQWRVEESTSEKIGKELEKHLEMFKEVFNNKLRVKNFAVYIKGVLSPQKRKSVEPIALEYMGESGVRTLQNFVTGSNFDDEAIHEKYQNELSRTINSANGMLSIDPSEFVKKGRNSAGVKRQYCGRLGKIENCQSVVFAAYAGECGYGIIDRELYLPKEWFADDHSKMRKKCGIPDKKEFKTKNEIALEMITEIVEQKRFHIKWFGCDHDFIDSLPKTAYYFVAVHNNERVFLWNEVAPISVKSLVENDNFPWEKVGFDGSKGVLYSDVKIIRCNATRTNDKNEPVRTDDIWLYIRRFPNGDTKYFLTNASDDIPPAELHGAATLRWPIEQCFEECKSDLGMADFEGRSYNGFLRHLLFVMIAHFFSTSLWLTFKKTVFP